MDHTAYKHMADNEINHWWFQGRRYFIAKKLENLKRENSSILEIGSGTGGNIKMLRKFGELVAMELDEFAMTVAEERHGLRAIKGSLPDNHPFEDGQFDLICLFDVLEHIEPDQESLVELQRLLRPGGEILITVPAYMFLWSTHDEIHHHFRRYNRKNLTEVASNAGFVVEEITNFNSLLLPLAIAGRLFARLTRSNASLGSGMPTAFINKILRSIFIWETRAFKAKGLPMGLSIYMRLSRKQ
jgi:SAM-dependent methyltransferase